MPNPETNETPTTEAEPRVEVPQGLETELASARLRIDELTRALSAAVNEQKGFRARLESEKSRTIEAERAKVALDLIELGDELERALTAATDADDAMARGVRMIHEGLARRLGAMGIERVPMLGRPFDPNLAEAVDLAVAELPEQDGVVIEELRAAYRTKDRLVREGRVRVGRFVGE